MGWNLIDFLQFFSFCSMQYFTKFNDQVAFLPELKLALLLLAFMKLMFFVRIFEKYGFLVQMIVYCVIDLVPFILSHLIF